MVSKASEDLPEPDRPVRTTSLSRGISRSTFLRLCSRAPRIEITRPPSRLRRGRLLSESVMPRFSGGHVGQVEASEGPRREVPRHGLWRPLDMGILTRLPAQT